MRLHVVGLPHTATTAEYSWCAYSMKVARFTDMMTSLGHEVLLYAAEENDAACAELIPCAIPADGDIPPFEPGHPSFAGMSFRVINEMRERAQSGDLLCLIAGRTQQPISQAFPELRTVEFGVGYEGVFSAFRVFESYAWMHAVYGHMYGAFSADGGFYDAVIPNSYDVEEFPAGDGDGGYLLYIGRLIERKGLEIVGLIAERTGMELVVAGTGDESLIPAKAEYVGSVGPKERGELMGRAAATVVPTLYVEPFGGVSVESMLCGTPVITTDWGAFPENVVQGRDGWRCRDMGEFTWAARHVGKLDRKAIREAALERFDMKNVRHVYDRYLRRVADLPGTDWYSAQERPPSVPGPP